MIIDNKIRGELGERLEKYYFAVIMLSLLTGAVDGVSLGYFARIFHSEGSGIISTEVVRYFTYFVVLTAIGYICKIILLWLNIWLSFKVSNLLNSKLMEASMDLASTTTTLSQTLDDISRVTEFVATNHILSTLKLISGAIVCTFITFSMWYNSDGSALFVLLILVGIYGLLSRAFRATFGKHSETIRALTSKTLTLGKSILEARETIVASNLLSSTINQWTKYDQNLKTILTRGQFFANSPRLFIELSGLLLIGILVLFSSNNLSIIFSEIALLIVSAQRLLPIVQQCYAALSARRIAAGQYIGIVDRISKLKPANIEISRLDDPIEWIKINLRTGSTLESIRLNPGDSLKITGSSGSGKSTLLRKIIGIVDDERINITINNSVYKNLIGKVGYVSQTSQLFEGTLKQNVSVFQYVSDEKCEQILETCQLLPLYKRVGDTIIDPNGTLLSGGEIQRVMIARILAMDKEILAFDEAFTGLDKSTASSILTNIQLNYPDVIKIFIDHSDILDQLDCKIVNVHELYLSS